MRWVRPVLNFYLRLTEKTYLRRAYDIPLARQQFERKARFFFHAPSGTSRSDGEIEDVPVLWVNKADVGPIVLYLHGGAYVFGSPHTHSAMIGRLLRDIEASACLPKYRLAPEHPFPAALEDAEKVYLALVKTGRPIFIGGDSAGGGLALALLARICAQNMPQPLGVFAFSPLTDCTFSNESIKSNARSDVMLPAERASEMIALYRGDAAANDPGLSPVFGEFRNACPVWLTAGDTEILYDDTTKMAERLRSQGVEVDVTIGRDLPHVWPIFHNILPEGRRSLLAVSLWISSLANSEAGN
ncbi:MAG: alpha/beta hydrolase fold domain-containing protein [Pseudomonadota bacterium]